MLFSNAIEMQVKRRPANRVNVDEERPINIQPSDVKGGITKNMVFRPVKPEINPPIGAKIVKLKKSKEANHDCWFKFNSRCGREIVANPTKTPREVLSKHAFNAAKTYFTKKFRIEGKLKITYHTWFRFNRIFSCSVKIVLLSGHDNGNASVVVKKFVQLRKIHKYT